MFTKKIDYVDFMGNKRSEEFMFNLTEAEIAEMDFGCTGGLGSAVRRIIQLQDQPAIIKLFKEIILKSYGEVSADGRRFVKINDAGVKLSKYFEETNAYSKLYMELATDSKAAAEFINGIVPGGVAEELKGVDLSDPNVVNNIIQMS